MDLVRVTRSLLRDAIKIFVSPQKKVESNSGTIAAWNFSAGFLIHYYYCETRSYRCHLTACYTFVWPALETQRLC